MAAGVGSGFVTAILQTKLGVDSLLAGIIVNTALYSVNIAVMGGSSLINMNRTTTVFTMMKDTLAGHSAEGKRGYHYCSDRSDPRDCISGIFPENKTWSCNPGNWKQFGYGKIFFDQSGIYNSNWSLCGKCIYSTFRMSFVSVTEICRYQYWSGYGNDCTGIPADRRNDPGTWRNFCESRGNGSWFFYLPPCIYNCTSVSICRHLC